MQPVVLFGAPAFGDNRTVELLELFYEPSPGAWGVRQLIVTAWPIVLNDREHVS